jgi:hypothetical protein
VFALVLAQAKDNPKIVWTLVVVAALSLLAIVEPFVRRLVAFIQTRRVRRTRDKAARAEHDELITFVRRFAPFTNSGTPNNIWHIIHSSNSNDFEKAEWICSTDYMKDLFPLFARQLETHPPENEKQFLRATEDLSLLIASYNRNYVSESLRRMREKRWTLPPTVVDSDLGTTRPANPSLGPWLSTLPPHYQESVGRQIEEFRERWAGFLDDMTKWLERVNDIFGTNLSTYFERPQKL